MFGTVQSWFLLAGSGVVYCAKVSGWGLFPDYLYVNQLVSDVYIEWRSHRGSMFFNGSTIQWNGNILHAFQHFKKLMLWRMLMIPGCSLLIAPFTETIQRFLVVFSIYIVYKPSSVDDLSKLVKYVLYNLQGYMVASLDALILKICKSSHFQNKHRHVTLISSVIYAKLHL